MSGIVTEFDKAMMRLALNQALNAATVGEVPVGAVIVRDGKLIATGFNHPIGSADPTAHAEVRALRAAAESSGNYRLPDCDLYVTLEPCAMCAGAILQARIRRVFFGARDPKTGVCGSVINLMGDHRLNHQTVVTGGLLEDDCGRTLRSFFVERRKQQRARRVHEVAVAGRDVDPVGPRSKDPHSKDPHSKEPDTDGPDGDGVHTSGPPTDRPPTNENAVASDGIEVEFLDDPADS